MAKRTALVVTDETARHPFLAKLPPHVRKGQSPVAGRRGRATASRDWRDFLSAYCASLAAVAIFIA
ncbi:MAG: hypothetical protein WCY11_07810 [Novosphingobium sp.]